MHGRRQWRTSGGRKERPQSGCESDSQGLGEAGDRHRADDQVGEDYRRTGGGRDPYGASEVENHGGAERMKIHGGARVTIDHGTAGEFEDRGRREDNHDAGGGKDCSRVHSGTGEVENHEAELDELDELENPRVEGPSTAKCPEVCGGARGMTDQGGIRGTKEPDRARGMTDHWECRDRRA